MRNVLLAVVVLVAGCGGGDAEEEPVALPGDYEAIIESEEDCQQLQAIFDTAEGAAANLRERGQIEGTDGAEGYTAVMNAAHEHMGEVGCYDE